MARWAELLIRDDFLNKTSRQALLSFLPTQAEAEYGLCIARKTLRGEQVIILQGNVPGYIVLINVEHTEFQYIPRLFKFLLYYPKHKAMPWE